MHVAVVALGGTISMTREQGASGVSPQLQAEELLRTARLPPGLEISATTLMLKASASLSFADMNRLADQVRDHRAAGVDGIVVTQGTDAIEETAFALDLLLPPEGPVIVTGAMRHAGAPGADGPANMAAALHVATHELARRSGVLVVMNDEIHAARFVRKAHTANVAAFTSFPCGPLGWFVEGRARLLLAPTTPLPRFDSLQGFPANVAILTVGMDSGTELIERCAAADVDGVVVAGMGGGHVPASQVDALEKLALAKPVVLASRTAAGETLRITYGYRGGEINLLHAGLISAGWLNPLKARILLIALLSSGATRSEIEAAFG
jgi:L-asparaginase